MGGLSLTHVSPFLCRKEEILLNAINYWVRILDDVLIRICKRRFRCIWHCYCRTVPISWVIPISLQFFHIRSSLIFIRIWNQFYSIDACRKWFSHCCALCVCFISVAALLSANMRAHSAKHEMNRSANKFTFAIVSQTNIQWVVNRFHCGYTVSKALVNCFA